MKRHHFPHHFHDENARYGIINFIPDRLFGTFEKAIKRPKQTPSNKTARA